MILDGAYEILGRAGIQVSTSTGFEAFKAIGAEVDASSHIVKLSRSLLDDCLASAPRALTLYGRDSKYNCCLQDQQVHMGTGGTALYVLDIETGTRRPSTLTDVAACAKLCDALSNVHIFTINVFPNEIKSVDDIDINRFYHSLQNTSKHVMGGIYSLRGTKEVVEMCQMIAGGKDALREKPFVSFIALVISPRKIDDIYGEITCYLAQQGLPVVTPTEPICGTTAPVTLAANVLMHVTETLAGVAMVQCVRKGSPVICGSVGSVNDLRTMQHLGGAIERGMINAAVAQVIHRIDLPLYSTAGTSDAKIVDSQSGYESALSNLLVMMSGAHYIHDSCGLMDSDMTVSYEKMVIDNEIIGMCGRVMRGIEVNDETLAVDLICDHAPGDGFMAEEHTVAHMRTEFFTPTIADRRHHQDWVNSGSTDAAQRAREYATGLLSKHQPTGLSGDVDNDIRAHFANIR